MVSAASVAKAVKRIDVSVILTERAERFINKAPGLLHEPITHVNLQDNHTIIPDYGVDQISMDEML